MKIVQTCLAQVVKDFLKTVTVYFVFLCVQCFQEASRNVKFARESIEPMHGFVKINNNLDCPVLCLSSLKHSVALSTRHLSPPSNSKP